MYEITSDLPRKEYLRELKGCFGSPFAVFDERIVGIVIGPFFSVAHHTEYEYDRRFNVLCNRAWGWVKTNPADGKTEVNFFRSSGLWSAFWLVFFTLLIPAMVNISAYLEGFGSFSPDEMGLVWIMSAAASLLICGLSTLEVVFTDSGAYGAGEITKLLRDPKDYYC